MRVGICGSHWLFLSLMNALSPVKPSMAPSPGALRIGLYDIRINGHTGVRDGFCFFKNESLTYSFYFLLLFLYLFSHTYHDFDHLIHLSFRELLWCNSLIYVYANWSAAYDNEIIKKKTTKDQVRRNNYDVCFIFYIICIFVFYYIFGILRNRDWVSTSFVFVPLEWVYEPAWILSFEFVFCFTSQIFDLFFADCAPSFLRLPFADTNQQASAREKKNILEETYADYF